MNTSTGNENLDRQINEWLLWDKNETNQKEIQDLLDSKNFEKLAKIFEKRLEFGTAGLRGVMAAGPSRMNDLTVIQVSQGLAKYLLDCFDDVKSKGVVIGFDARFNSLRFARLAARAFVSMGVPVQLFDDIVPTPFVPFTVCQVGAKLGIMVTASHNPKEDNGYKVFWDNGAQILSPHDKNIVKYSLENLAPWDGAWNESSTDELLVSNPTSMVKQLYFAELSKRCILDDANTKTALKFTYTPVHGVGAASIKQAFEMLKLQPFVAVEEQIRPDPYFSTVTFPNPEERDTLKLALATASKNRSTVILANDPDADRLACAELQPTGLWKIFTGNELGCLLGWWMWHRAASSGVDPKRAVMISSTVSSKILETISKVEGFHFEETLTGFKWMANRGLQLKKEGFTILFAFEEALGYMCGIDVPDKDGVSAASHLCELAVYLEKSGMTLTDQLNSIYNKYGYHVAFVSYYLCYEPVVIQRIFNRLRNFHGAEQTYPDSLLNGVYPVSGVRDLTTGFDSRQSDKKAALPSSSSSQMITFYFRNGLEITIRTSGTEPKIKYYTELRTAPGTSDLVQTEKTLKEMVDAMVEEFLQPTVNQLVERPE